MGKEVLVAVADGIEEIETVCIVDTLRRGGASVTIASVADLNITASRGVKLVADKRISECTGQQYDLIALPGGMPGAEYLRDCPELIEMVTGDSGLREKIIDGQRQRLKKFQEMKLDEFLLKSLKGLLS